MESAHDRCLEVSPFRRAIIEIGNFHMRLEIRVDNESLHYYYEGYFYLCHWASNEDELRKKRPIDVFRIVPIM